MKKKIFYFGMLLFATLVFTGCPGGDDDPKTTYTLKCNVDADTAIEVTTIEYNGSEVVRQQSFNCVKGFKRVITANSKATKVKVKAFGYWVMMVYYLEDGKNIDIELNNNTKMIEIEPPF